jgi:pilus assembly protein CpaF
VIRCKLNVLVGGGTGSGKTSMLNALSGAIGEGERVVVIEDARELRLQRDHVVSLEARPPDARGQGAVSVRDLFRATLRMRPDRIVVGEIRGPEALDLVQAMTSGHGGCLSTVHATYPRDALSRLETLALMSDVALPLPALRAQIGSAVDMIVQTARVADGTRKVTHISEVSLGEAGEPVATDVFVRSYRGRDARGVVQSRLVPTGFIPRCRDLLHGQGYELPDEVLRAAKGARLP